jgi:sec-independent protein translocase protein TatA
MYPACSIPTASCLALIGDVGGMELLVIMGAVLILFGGKGLPGIARYLGKITRNLQRASEEFKNQLLTADQPDAADTAATTENTSKAPGVTGVSPVDAQGTTTKRAEPHDTAG